MVPPNFDRYLEPFAGSACLFFALRPSEAVLGDLNSDLIETYAVVRDRPAALWGALSKLPDTPSFYYELRDHFRSDASQLQRVARFIYLNRFCFNAVYRTNRAGRFNVPRGRSTGSLPSEREFLACAEVLGSATLFSGDFATLLADARPRDFVYLDPPYFREGRRVYGEYGYGTFSDRDLPRLLDVLTGLDDR
ncbi:MAG TPA: Dam family site-specific DNA-(adenine-N6)-methyltransferase, partial [Thermoanaerobaculia bacterium]|nr:Dam family site-specific DNA-(adenine-N6)-methyltransferase [Thermoanaerobaculia bacterium]